LASNNASQRPSRLSNSKKRWKGVLAILQANTHQARGVIPTTLLFKAIAASKLHGTRPPVSNHIAPQCWGLTAPQTRFTASRPDEKYSDVSVTGDGGDGGRDHCSAIDLHSFGYHLDD